MNILHDFTYHKPTTQKEALDLAAQFGAKAKFLAGGTDLVIQMKEQMLAPEVIIDISDIAELKGIKIEAGKGAVIGACTTISEIEFSDALAKKFGALKHAAGELGSNQVRVMATIGGNSCHSSPAAETPASLCAYGAKVVIASAKGEREMPLEDFIQGNRTNALETGEMVTKFVLPEPAPKSACKYGCIGLRKAMEIDAVNMAVCVKVAQDGTIEDVKLVMGSVAPRPLISAKVPELLKGQKLTDDLLVKIGEAAQSEAKPISDVRASAEYRKDVVAVLARRLTKAAYEAAKEA